MGKPSITYGLRLPVFAWQFLALCGALAILPVFMRTYHVIVLTDGLIMGVLAMTVVFLLGFGGMLSFGQAGFFGIGCYTVAITLVKLGKIGVSFWVTIPLGVALAAVYGLIVGFCCTRGRGIYFAILTLAFAEILAKYLFYTRYVAALDIDFGGHLGIHGLPVRFVPEQYYYMVLAAVLISYLVLRKIVNSPFGKVLQAIRENEDRVRFVGYNVDSYKIVAFTIASVFAGLAGTFYAGLHAFAAPELVAWHVSGEAVVAAFIGGVGTLAGGIVGGVFLLLLIDVLGSYWKGYLIAIGLLLALIIIFVPEGLFGVVKRRVAKRVSL